MAVGRLRFGWIRSPAADLVGYIGSSLAGWLYGLAGEGDSHRWSRASFRSVPAYLGLGLLFTFACYQEPWVELVEARLATAVDAWHVGGVGLVAGLSPVGESGLGARVAATLFMGWAMQHYYLDSRIWRVRRDPQLSEHLHLDRASA